MQLVLLIFKLYLKYCYNIEGNNVVQLDEGRITFRILQQ